ncbi:MAG: hypothetical protein ACMUIP_14650 [bacterium]
MKNHYKRSDIFRCTHESHHGFGNVVSVYHVLKEKKCYPDGCIYFKWLCKKLNKGIACPKSFKHVGRMCPSCPDYYDEKVFRHPELLLPEKEYDDFLKELENFKFWLDSKRGREIECSGTIKSVKPRFIMKPHNKRFNISLKGFLLVFDEGFIDLTHFEDIFFGNLSLWQQSRLRLGKGDRIEFCATLYLDRGRILLDRVRGIDIEEKAEAQYWSVQEAKQALLRCSTLEHQSEKCLNCSHSCLVDIMEPGSKDAGHPQKGQKRRQLLCLKGVSAPEYCIEQAYEKLYQVDYCQDEGI